MFMTIKSFEPTTQPRRAEPEILLLALRAIDADCDSPVKAWVFVQRTEHYTYQDGPKRLIDVRESRIDLTFFALDPHGGGRALFSGSFCGSYSRFFNRISLTGGTPTSKGAVLMPSGLRGLRLGTFLLNTVVGWAMQWPEAEVNSIHVVENDGYPDNRARRNRLYERFGLIFDYTDDKKRAGQSRPMPAGELTQIDAEAAIKKNITVHRVPDGFALLLSQNRALRAQLDAREQAVASLSGRLKRYEEFPLRVATVTLWRRHARWLITSAIMALFIVLGIYRYNGS